MQQTLFSLLQWYNPKASAHSYEQVYFDSHASFFDMKTNVYNDVSSLFSLIRADIVLQGAINTKEIARLLLALPLDALGEKEIPSALTGKLRYFLSDGVRVFDPNLPLAVNRAYNEDLLYLARDHRDILKKSQNYEINPFETYGNSLYASLFTRMVKLDVGDSYSDGFFHPSFETLFVIDKKGCLVEEIPLFDEKAKMNRKEEIYPRLNLLLKDYYLGDETRFTEDLLALGFISEDLYAELEDNQKHRNRRRERRRKR